MTTSAFLRFLLPAIERFVTASEFMVTQLFYSQFFIQLTRDI